MDFVPVLSDGALRLKRRDRRCRSLVCHFFPALVEVSRTNDCSQGRERLDTLRRYRKCHAMIGRENLEYAGFASFRGRFGRGANQLRRTRSKHLRSASLRIW
jgi:hypothetical protein